MKGIWFGRHAEIWLLLRDIDALVWVCCIIYRLAFYEFVNNEDIKRLFVYIRPPRQITASLQPPHDLKSKSIFFMKCNPGTKLTKDNLGTVTDALISLRLFGLCSLLWVELVSNFVTRQWGVLHGLYKCSIRSPGADNQWNVPAQ